MHIVATSSADRHPFDLHELTLSKHYESHFQLYLLEKSAYLRAFETRVVYDNFALKRI